MKILSLKRRHCTECMGAETEEGFTLIELMVVLLIMAILIAIAIPTFLGVRGSAQNRAAQSNLTSALTAAGTVINSAAQSFLVPPPSTGGCSALTSTTDTACILSGDETSLIFCGAAGTVGLGGTASTCYAGGSKQGTATPTVSNAISELHGSTSGQAIAFADESANGICWFVVDVNSDSSTTAPVTTSFANPGEWYGASKAPSTGCAASFAAPSTGWKTSFPSGAGL